MTITVFLDSNIIMSDYKMNGTTFEELFKVHEEITNGENFNLMITEMTYHEILEHFKTHLNKTFKTLSAFKNELIKLTEIKSEFNPKEMKERILEEYKDKLNNLFLIESSSKEATSNVFTRFYHQEMPFRDNKKEFKDALIWETVYEYAELNSDEKVFFVSKNHKDFAVEIEKGKYKLHDHFDSLNDRIKYINGLNDFLLEINHLRVHHFDFNEEDEVIENIKNEISQSYIYSPKFDGEMHNFFSNHHFRSDYIEGWGSDYYIEDVYEFEINDRSEVLETDGLFYVPISFLADISYSVENKNPIYERDSGDDEFMQSDSIEDSFLFECVVKYNPKDKEIIDIDEISLKFL